VTRQKITTKAGPAAIGPYSQAIVCGEMVFVSGQIPLDPATGAFVQGGIEAQTRQVMRNIGAILEAAGSSLDQVVKTTVYLADLNDFDEMNRTYGTFFTGDPPARATVQVAKLPRGASVEIDAISIKKS